MVDELIYSELAKSLADSGRFLIRGEATAAYGIVYPALIAPAWALFESVPQAYAAAKAINALVMSLAAVPAYFLARRVLAEPLALVAAALTVAVPSMVYTATLMTENAFYPLFLCAALAMVLWLERPTPLRTAIVLGVCLVAYLTRQQAVALLPALLTAPLYVAGRAAFRRYALLYGLAAAGFVGILVVQLARGRSPLGVFGAYEVAGRADYSVGEVAKWFVVPRRGAQPLAGRDPVRRADPPGADAAPADRARPHLRRSRAQPVLLARARSGRVRLRADVSHRGAEHVLRRPALPHRAARLDRARPAETATGDSDWQRCIAVGLPLAIPYDDFIGINAVSDTAALLPLGWLVEQGLALSDASLVVLAGAVVAGLAFLFVPRRYALALPALVLVYFAVSQYPIVDQHRFRSAQHLFGGIAMKHRDWIDRSVGRDADVAFLWTGTASEFAIWENEIFSRSIGDIYTTGPAVPGGSCADAGLDRQEHRLRARTRRRPGAGVIRAHRRNRGVRRHRGRRGRGQAPGALSRSRPAAPGRVRRRALSAGHVVGQERDVHAPRLPRWDARDRGAERRGPVRHAEHPEHPSGRAGDRPRDRRPAWSTSVQCAFRSSRRTGSVSCGSRSTARRYHAR